MKTKIPIYRAKKIDSDEYIEFEGKVTYGSRMFAVDSMFMVNNILHLDYRQEIDPSTLAIHFPDMIDSEGTKIFASLSEDGKGGDIVDFGYNCLKRTSIFPNILSYRFNNSKVIGIQQ